MKAWIVERQAPIEQRPFRLADVAAPTPRGDELLVRVIACAVCRTDLHVVEGDLPLRRTPTIPGHQVVGEVIAAGADVRARIPGGRIGERVGIPWLHRACGERADACRFCRSQRENLCERAEFTGWNAAGGFAELVTVPEAFAVALPRELAAVDAAPLLCAGIIGFRALRLAGLFARAEPGFRLGLYGFGAAGHLALQTARARGADVYVCTRDRARHQALARELGAAWVGDGGGSDELPPVKLDAAVIFAPAGELVPSALRALDEGGRLILGGIHMSPIPELPYALLYRERSLQSVTNATRADGRDFLAEAARAHVHAQSEPFPFGEADRALLALKNDAVRGAAVLVLP